MRDNQERLERLAFTGCLMTKIIPEKLELSDGVWSLNVEPLNLELPWALNDWNVWNGLVPLVSGAKRLNWRFRAW
jgi:hypothetical protein